MTQDEIIEIAMLKAEFVSHGKPSDKESELFVCTDKDIVRFAYLIAAKEREACAKLIDPTEEHRKDASWGYIGGNEGVEMLDALAAAIRARGQA